MTLMNCGCSFRNAVILAVTLVSLVAYAGQAGDPSLRGTIAWYAAKAKAEGKTAIDIGNFVSPGIVDLSLESAIQVHSLVLAQPLAANSYVESGRSIVTWHKFRLLELISRREARPFELSLKDVPQDIYPNELLPLGPKEFLVLRGAGAVIVDGVVVSSGKENSPEFSSPQPVLLFVSLDRLGQVAKLPLGGKGVFHIAEQDKIRPLVEVGNPVASDIRYLHQNSLRRIRAGVGR